MRKPQIKCLVTFETRLGGVDNREVLLPGPLTQGGRDAEARAALYRQHDIGGAIIKSVKLADDQPIEEQGAAA